MDNTWPNQCCNCEYFRLRRFRSSDHRQIIEEFLCVKFGETLRIDEFLAPICDNNCEKVGE